MKLDIISSFLNLQRLVLWPSRAPLIAQLVNNLPATQETWVQSLGWEDSLEKGMAYPLQYSGLEDSMDCIVHGVVKSGTWLSDFHFHFSDYKSHFSDYKSNIYSW